MSKRNRKSREQKSVSAKKQLENAKRIQSLKTMYFNRFMVVRYTCAACFIGNLYYTLMAWPLWMSWLSAALMVLALPALWQLGTMYGKKKVSDKWIRIYTPIQWLFNALMLVSLWTLPVNSVMPFFSDTMMARIVGSLFCAAGLILGSLSLVRLQHIASGTDRVFRQIRFYEQKYNLSIDSAA